MIVSSKLPTKLFPGFPGVKYLYLFGKKVNGMVFQNWQISETFGRREDVKYKSFEIFKLFPKM